MRLGLVEENETAEFVPVLTGIWHVVREMTFWSKAVTTHVRDLEGQNVLFSLPCHCAFALEQCSA